MFDEPTLRVSEKSGRMKVFVTPIKLSCLDMCEKRKKKTTTTERDESILV